MRGISLSDLFLATTPQAILPTTGSAYPRAEQQRGGDQHSEAHDDPKRNALSPRQRLRLR